MVDISRRLCTTDLRFHSHSKYVVLIKNECSVLCSVFFDVHKIFFNVLKIFFDVLKIFFDVLKIFFAKKYSINIYLWLALSILLKIREKVVRSNEKALTEK